MGRIAEQDEEALGAREGGVRIGELGRRVGVRPDTLRAWERRYRLLEPARTEAGYRLYSAADEARVRRMTALMAEGFAAAEAAALAREGAAAPAALETGATEAGRDARDPRSSAAVPHAPDQAGAGAAVPAPAVRPVLDEQVELFVGAVMRYDETAANESLDLALGMFSLDAVLSDLVLPALAEIGERWRRDELKIAHEHFATELVRARLLALARGWGGGDGPLALLACAPGERHDLGLLSFGLVLRQRGWRIAFLGTDTPSSTLGEAADELEPDAVIVAAVDPVHVERCRRDLRRVAERHPMLLGGAAANPELARSVGAVALERGPVDSARWIARTTEPV